MQSPLTTYPKPRSRTRDMILCALFAVLIAAGAFIRIPVPVVPFTLQFLFTCLAGSLLGSRRGLISVLVYLVLGLIGLPIFAEGGGIWYVMKPTFGYLLGFAAGTFVTGFLLERCVAKPAKNPRPDTATESVLSIDMADSAGPAFSAGIPGATGDATVSHQPAFAQTLAANFAGLAVVYAVGMVWCYLISNFVLGVPLGIWPLFLYCFLLAVPGDICLCILAAVLTRRLKGVIAL